MADVAIVGRPNVGKSSLFNRLLGSNLSIVEPTPGVTRDRLEAICDWSGRHFTLTDTGGVMGESQGTLQAEVDKQVDEAITSAKVVVWVTSQKDGVTPADEAFLHSLTKRKIKKPVLIVVNKVDREIKQADLAEFYGLGFGEPIVVSAMHGRGIGDLLDCIVEALGPADAKAAEDVLHIAIVGRPNVGKSSLFNALIGEDRVVVHDSPGTTRDAIDTRITLGEKEVVLIDTAGLRRRSLAGNDSIEFYSRTRTLRAVQRADVALLVLEAPNGVQAQDKRIAGELDEAGKGVVVLANKWDRLQSSEASVYRDFTHHVREALYFLHDPPILATSAVTGVGVTEILPIAFKVNESYRGNLDTFLLRKVLDEATFVFPVPVQKGKQVRIQSIEQVGTRPPSFLVRARGPGKIPDSYLHFLEGKLRDAFDLKGVPVRFVVKHVQRRGKKR